MYKLTRRKLLSTALEAAVAIEAGSRLGWLPALVFPVKAGPLPSVVVANGTNDDSPEAILRSAIDNLGGIGRFIKPGQTVAIKPNATWAYPPGTASSSDPVLLAALVKVVQEAGAGRIIVMDHCSIEPGAAESLRVNGIGKMVKSLGVESVFPDRFSGPKDLYKKVDLPKGKAFKTVGVIKAAIDADVRINLAVAKTHNVTRMTMCMKHMMGFLENPGSLHSYLSKGIVDINGESPFQANLHILEAIRVRVPWGDYQVCAGPETEITNPLVIKRKNQIIAGIDPILIDAYGCQTYYSLEPKKMTYINLGAEAGLGEIDLEKTAGSGYLQSVNVGDFPATSEPTKPAVQLTPTAGETASIQIVALPPPTSTPLPTAAEVTLPEVAPLTNDISLSSPPDIVSPNQFLRGALIPVAAIITGIGLTAWHRLMKLEKKESHDQPKK